MPSHTAPGPRKQSPIELFGLSPVEQACVRQLIGQTLALIEREFILQTLRFSHGNRTRSADLLGISIRSLRDKIRNYRNDGENVPEPGAPLPEGPAGDGLLRH